MFDPIFHIVLNSQYNMKTRKDLRLLRGGFIWQGQKTSLSRGWMLIDGAIVKQIGTEEEPYPTDAEILDLDGRHVLPGFVDSHTHLSASALIPVSYDASSWTCVDDALAAVRNAVHDKANDEWLVFFYMDFSSWSDRSQPTASQLEEASNGRPVLLADISLHRGVLSSSGLRLTNISEDSADVFGDIEKGKRGILTGLVWESAFSRALTIALTDIAKRVSDQGIERLLFQEAERHLSLGITDAHDPTISPDFQPLMSRLRSQSPLRLSWSVVGRNGMLTAPEATDLYADYGSGPKSAKLFLDGAHRCAMCLEAGDVLRMTKNALQQAFRKKSTAAMQALLKYRVKISGGHLHIPYLRYEESELLMRMDSLLKSGMRLKVHALGNLAAMQIASALKIARPDQLTCLEHLMVLSESDMDKLTKVDILASLQPGFIPHYGPFILDQGVVPALKGIPLQSLISRGIPTAISSDNPCGPLDPLHNIRCAVDRQLPDGRSFDASEALRSEQAIYAATLGGMVGITGKPKQGIEAGATADFVICSGHPMQKDSYVTSTWIEGQPVWVHPKAIEKKWSSVL